MKKKTGLLMMAMMFLFVVLLCWRPADTQAASTRKVNLNANKTYKNYDITGDKKKDSIQVKTTNTSLAVIVNGKTVYTDKTEIDGGTFIQYCQLGNGMPLLFIRGFGINDMSMAAIVYYKSGKPASLSLGNWFKDYGWISFIDDLKLSEDSFRATYSVMFQSTGITGLKPQTFVCKKGMITCASKIWNISGFHHVGSMNPSTKFKTAKSLTAYTDTSAKKKAFTVRSGATVNIRKMYYNGKVMLLNVEYNGKQGWIKALKTRDKLFTNVAYGG